MVSVCGVCGGRVPVWTCVLSVYTCALVGRRSVCRCSACPYSELTFLLLLCLDLCQLHFLVVFLEVLYGKGKMRIRVYYVGMYVKEPEKR